MRACTWILSSYTRILLVLIRAVSRDPSFSLKHSLQLCRDIGSETDNIPLAFAHPCLCRFGRLRPKPAYPRIAGLRQPLAVSLQESAIYLTRECRLTAHTTSGNKTTAAPQRAWSTKSQRRLEASYHLIWLPWAATFLLHSTPAR